MFFRGWFFAALFASCSSMSLRFPTFETMKFVSQKIIAAFFLFPVFAFSQQHYETKMLRNTENQKIQQYETVEIGIRIPLQERMFQNFLQDHSRGSNPYTQHFLHLQFICHGKSYIVPAFYMQNAVPDEKLNKYVPSETEWPWRVRFAVPDTGNWQCLILTGESVERSTPQDAGISFDCIPGNNHGYLNVAHDQKHFQFSDGTPFFPLGENIAWAEEPVLHGYPGPPPAYNDGYYDVYHYINNLADNGGNYVRFYMAPWSTGLESDAVGIYDQTRAVALDSMMRIAEMRGLHVQLSLDLSMGFGKNIPEDQWSPYRKAFEKEAGTAADVLNDTNALKQFDNYIRYVYARWAFSPAIASIEILSEQNYWDGFDEHEIYFENFIHHVNDLLRNELGDHVHMISSSSGEKKYAGVFTNPDLSFIDIHHYSNSFYSNKKRFSIIHDRVYEKINKPFMFGETGMINGPKNNSDAGDFEGYDDINYHNTFWASTFSGCAGTALYWWSWDNDKQREQNLPALRYFIDSIAGPTLFDGESKMWDGNGLETFYKISPGKSVAIGWVHNQSYWWGNVMQNYRDRYGKEKFLPKDNDKAEKPESRIGEKFEVNGLIKNRNYWIKFYDTRTRGKIIGSQKVKSNRFGKLILKLPSDGADCAFRISPAYSTGELNWSF